jgi:uncharacterized protein
MFNSIVRIEENYALYNSFDDKITFISSELRDMLEASMRENPEKLAAYHPSFFRMLVHNGFIVDDSLDEVHSVVTRSGNVDETSTEFTLTINPTMNCNFKCWYCYETHIKNSKMNGSEIDRILKFVDNTIEGNPNLKHFYLSFFGGEPLLYFSQTVVPITDAILKKCKEHNIDCNIIFTTNGYLINSDFIDYFKSQECYPTLQITLDGNKQEHDKVRFVSGLKGSYDKISANTRLLLANDFFVRLRINYTDSNIHHMEEIAKDFSDLPTERKETGLMFDFHRVWQNEKGKDIEEAYLKTIQKFREHDFVVSSQRAMNNVNDSCYADKRNSVVINYNGDIFKCTARDFTRDNREGYIDNTGSLVWENDALEKRMKSKFQNEPCLTCRILPLCNGGCSQQAIENKGTSYCIHDFDSSKKDQVVKAKIEELTNGLNKVDVPPLKEKAQRLELK